ncbi:MAG: cell division protein ZipA C-terminal FtsZ-binding domain-containing protein, partial [Burkholderiaceae bacterium]
MNAMLENLPVSPLQLGLILAGVLLLVLLVLWNGWKTRRNTPKQPDSQFLPPDAPGRSASHSHDGSRRDPVFEHAALRESASETDDQNGQNDRLDRGEGTNAPDGLQSMPDGTRVAGAATTTAADDASTQGIYSAPTQSVERRPLLDPLIDVIATIALDAPMTHEAVLHAMPPTRRVGSKPFAVEGQSDGSDLWGALQPGDRYRALQAGVQMANRTGALNEIEFSEFVVKTQAFADALGGACEFPEMLHEVARARELDQFASDHDAQLGLHVHAQGSSWSPGYVQQQATRLGFQAGPIPGRMVLPGPDVGQPPLLTLSFDTQAALAEDPTQAAMREVRLSLDVPQVDRSARPFAKMRDIATKLASAMEGVVTDERGQRLPPAAMDQIQTEVERLYDKLDGRDLSAGS